MATIKSFTSLEQSKKLADILPLESADMFYDGVQDLYKEKVYNIPIDGSSITVRTGHTITEKGIKANLLLPAWSLAALLRFLPFHIISKNERYGFDMGKGLDRNGETYMIRYNIFSTDICLYKTDYYNNPVDAAYELILKLHELNLL